MTDSTPEVIVNPPDPPVEVTVNLPAPPVLVTVQPVGLPGRDGRDGQDATDVGGVLYEHIHSETPHPVYDEGPNFLLLYRNAKV